VSHEVRQNKATKEWVLYATSRGDRPHDVPDTPVQQTDIPDYDTDCPFCPGNESQVEKIIAEQCDATTGHWQTRVMPNKYPVVVPHGDATRSQHGLYLTMPAYGRHEVIVEHPVHNQDIATMTPHEVEQVIETYHRRYRDLMTIREHMLIIIFRNHGTQAGTSLLHPHSQIVATGFVPNYIRWREEEARRYFDEWGCCVFLDMLAFEQQEQRRIVVENDTFLAFVPFAAIVPFEVWIMPKRPQADFGVISDSEKSDLAHALREVLSRLRYKLNNPDYNYIINTPARYQRNEPHLQWYLQVRPRLTTTAGFEIGSGISVNPSLPEEDADVLNSREMA
jgi:UDPglucose--hexose-1-phosphate uridylyltransferase